MTTWFIPALKAVLPHVGTIVSAAVPVFTRKNTDAAANQALLQQQITELSQPFQTAFCSSPSSELAYRRTSLILDLPINLSKFPIVA